MQKVFLGAVLFRRLSYGCGDLNYFAKNNRLKSFKNYIDGKYIETIPIKDSIHFEQYALKNPVK
jgi:hypothetical protein